MFRTIRLSIFLALFLFGAVSLAVQADAPHVNVLKIKGTINPVLAEYIKRGIEESAKSGAAACIIQMDTPGGLDSAMRDIVQSIVNARVPVVVYVSPSGARAASAGVFITISAHIAAMAPNTAIGAAHPVAMGTSGGEQQLSDEMAQKVTNDAAAYIRSLASSRGRNADWAEKAVRESVSITETEARQQNVIDIVSPTLEDLLTQLNGRKVILMDGSSTVLETQSIQVNQVGMGWIEDFLFTVSDPNIAYILLSIGSLGIMAEIFHPGMIFPGVLGAICLLLAFYSLGMMPVNWAGVALIILAFGLFIAEFFTPGFGALFGSGVVSFIIGSLILFKGGSSPLFHVDWWLIALVIILVAGFVAFAAFRIAVVYRRQATTGKEDLKGKTAVVRVALDPEGTVLYQGELWAAISNSGKIEPGEEVTIAKIDGLRLTVTKKAKE